MDLYFFEEQTGVYIGTTTFFLVIGTILGTIGMIPYRFITLWWLVSIVKKNVPAPILGTHTNEQEKQKRTISIVASHSLIHFLV